MPFWASLLLRIVDSRGFELYVFDIVVMTGKNKPAEAVRDSVR